MSKAIVEANFKEAQQILGQFLSSEENLNNISEGGELIYKAVSSGNKVMSCGNGGSMCDAMHFAEEMTGRFRENRKPFPAMAVSDPSHISCTANDYGYEFIFSRIVESFGKPGDVLLAISTSGNSENVLNAAKVARENGVKVVALTGKTGGKLANNCDVEIRAPHSEYADRAQEIHIKVIHSLIHYVESRINE